MAYRKIARTESFGTVQLAADASTHLLFLALGIGVGQKPFASTWKLPSSSERTALGRATRGGLGVKQVPDDYCPSLDCCRTNDS